MRLSTALLTFAVVFLVGLNASAADPEKTKADLQAFQEYLKKQYPEKKWQTGPSAIDSEEIRAAYGKKRFYYVFSAPPLPPGAPVALEAYQKKLEDHRKNYVSLTVCIDEQGKLTPLVKAEDYNAGLMPVKTDDDAKVAAAAILSLIGADQVAPGPLSAKAFMVKKTDNGWFCSVAVKNQFTGGVIFAKDGTYRQASKNYAGPLPP